MAIISLYIAGVLLLGVFSMLVMYNYWRYRLVGDHTRTILAVFSIVFILIALTGLTFMRSDDAGSNNDQANSDSF